VSPRDIVALLLRHRIPVILTALVAGILSFQLIHANPGYTDSGGVMFTAPKSSGSLFDNMQSLQAAQEAVAGYMMDSQGEQRVRAAGGTASYNVAMLNSYNEDFPDYSQPYVTITVMSDQPAAAGKTFRTVLGVLREATAVLQAQVGASPKNEVQATLVAVPTGPIAQGGSRKRSYAAFAVLTIIATYLVARVLDRRRRRRRRRWPDAAHRRRPGSGRHAATTLHPASISLRLAWGRLMLGIAPKRGPKGVKASRRTEQKARILIIVQNLPVPFDRRVWLECGALVSAGYQVAVVCPKGRNDPSFEVVDSVEIYKYRPYAPGGSKAGFIAEYIYSFLATALHVVRARRSGRFAVIQACNPPDIFWPIAMFFRVIDRSRFVFDHHDLCPELYLSRFPDGPRLPYHGLLALERRTHRTADHVISTNDSYREIAIVRSGRAPGDVTVVRTGPDPERLRRGAGDQGQRRGRKFLAAYIGVMGPQDGVDIVIRAAGVIVHEMRRDDIAFTLIGSGDCFDELVALRDELGLRGHVEFTGRAPDELVGRILSTADVGLSPDPLNPLNDLSTMNKSMEYMAFELPVVAFDLRETRVSVADAGRYVEPNDIGKYAQAIVELLDDEPARLLLGKRGRARVEEELAWPFQEKAYLDVYRRLTSANRHHRSRRKSTGV
jgi:glycosyltransferase involved in cell wall biosynthesis